MKTTLIKLQNKFILVSDKQPVNGWYFDTFINKVRNTSSTEYAINNITKQIIAGMPSLPAIDFSLLSEEDCLKIGYVDVEKLAEKANCYGVYGKGLPKCNVFDEGYKTGFKTAQSLNDKMFSLNEVKGMLFEIANAMRLKSINAYAKYFNDKDMVSNLVNKKLQSLQQISWDVEVNELNQIIKIV